MLVLRDPVSSSSHLLTAVWAVFATLVMFRLTTNRPGRMLPVLIYGASMVALFLASGTFHALPFEKGSWSWRLFQKIDQTAVYLLIAGTYTPVLSVLLAGAWRKWFLRMVWTLAAAGISCLWLLPKAPHWAVVAIYLSLGWIGILPLPLYYRAVGWRAMNWMWAGALLYTVGAVCEITEWPIVMPGFGFHEVLHLCDSAANMVFFLFVVRYVIPYQPAPHPAEPAGVVAAAKPAPVVS
ncbi:hemolysin-III related [Gemmata obscuriglobus]|nr:hemolysin-III related [Gemmata obscuriglobus]VTS07875.1 hemolysin iii family channel protein : Hemolysin III family channel protein OS=Tumebacillus flagellatus GN=EL26_07930 PE=4 SV=1: HlyIII [Gemmata obscuriglobus UQM 2246]